MNGARSMDISKTEKNLENKFPSLASNGYHLTSPEDPLYNCIAWIFGETEVWWEPFPGCYWPIKYSFVKAAKMETILALFEHFGFEGCKGCDPEEGYERVAIYGKDGEWTHAAKQISDGKWTSKLGPNQDIEHDTLDCLVGDEYGRVVKILRRRLA